MTFLEKLQAIERVNQLIRLKATGSPKELAARLGITRSTVYELIKCMKTMGADIQYCRRRRSFYYGQEVVLKIGFVAKKRVVGGEKMHSFLPSDFFGQWRFNLQVNNVI